MPKRPINISDRTDNLTHSRSVGNLFGNCPHFELPIIAIDTGDIRLGVERLSAQMEKAYLMDVGDSTTSTPSPDGKKSPTRFIRVAQLVIADVEKIPLRDVKL